MTERSAETDALFVTYERTRRETIQVAKVTAENIGRIASLIGGSVDYASGAPELVLPEQGWRVRVGWSVSLMGKRLVNRNGFNNDGDWTLTTPGDLS